MRPGVICTILASVWVESVRNPAWLPVNDAAGTPRSLSAMAMRAQALRSPPVMSMATSRPGGSAATWEAILSSWSVSLPMADTTSTTSSPRPRRRATWSATTRMRSGSATEVPPNFSTTNATADLLYRRPG